MNLRLFGNIVWEAFQWIALLGGTLGVVVGLLLVFNSPLVFRFGERVNVWISTRQAMRPLEEPINIERSVYRYHRIFGVLILAGALYTLYVMALRFQGPELAAMLTRLLRLKVAVWVAQSARIFLITVNAAAVLIALVMILRPSALKGVEEWANRRYSGRRAMKEWETPRGGIDRLVGQYPRVVGAVLSLAGLYIWIAIGLARFAR